MNYLQYDYNNNTFSNWFCRKHAHRYGNTIGVPIHSYIILMGYNVTQFQHNYNVNVLQ